MNWFTDAVKNKYAQFDGRAHRTEFWMYALLYVLIAVAISTVEGVIGITFGVVGFIYAVALFVPGLAITARRLHDTDRSGWWMLVGFVPLVGWIVLLVFLVQETQPVDNQFGPQPAPAP